LIIELDAGHHMGEEKDEIRINELMKLEFRVLRFWNNEVLFEIDSVIAKIQKVLEE